MAKKNNKTDDQFAQVEGALTRTEQFIEDNQDKIVKIGNSALNGATHLLLSDQARNKLVKYVKQINHLELETKTEFFDYFVEGCQFKKINL